MAISFLLPRPFPNKGGLVGSRPTSGTDGHTNNESESDAGIVVISDSLERRYRARLRGGGGGGGGGGVVQPKFLGKIGLEIGLSKKPHP